MKSRVAAFVLTAGIAAASIAVPAFAWDTKTYLEEPATNVNGYVIGWHWVDWDGDGVFECYYSNENGMLQSDTTTPDGYTLDAKGRWVVDGVVQTRTRETQPVSIDYSAYDPSHPLANVVDAWGLRLEDANFETGTIGTVNSIVNWNVHAMLTNQMDKYQEPGGSMAELQKEREQQIYQWYCNWLNSFDFQHMTEMERAKQISDLLYPKFYDYEQENSANLNNYPLQEHYAILILNKGVCRDFAVTAVSLARALGLKATYYSGDNIHINYFVRVDGDVYLGSNGLFNLITKYDNVNGPITLRLE